MKISDLQAFVEVYRQQSFTKAARGLHISQSDLSKRVRSLQDELNTQLVDTSNRRKLRFTSSGKIVYQHASAMINQSQEMMKELAGSRNIQNKVLNVGTIPVTGQYQIAAATSDFNQHYPNLQIRLIEGEGKDVITLLREGKLDAAILRDTQTRELNELDFQRYNLISDQLMVIFSRDCILSQEPAISVSDLKDKLIASLPAGSGVYEPITKIFQEQNMTPHVFFDSSHIETLTGVLSNHRAVTILFRRSAEPFVNERLTMKPLQPVYTSMLQFIYPKSNASYQMQRLEQYLKKYMNDHLKES